jgi:anaerobic C4-dicarboxylate transporter
MPPPSLCGGALNSRRGLLASLWSVVVCLTFIAFIVALIFTLSAANSNSNDDDNNNNYYNNNNNEPEQERQDSENEMAVTSRAMAFCALWTAVLASLMAIFGAVILGWQSPTGMYYTCCSPQVHRTTPLALGSFIGALMMFANLTLVCSVLFGEFDVSPSTFVSLRHLL